MDLWFAETARADLAEVLQWFHEQGAADAGSVTVRSLLARIELLRAHPYLGRQVPEFDDPGLRELIRPPYRVVYRVTDSGIEVARVWRSERPLGPVS